MNVDKVYVCDIYRLDDIINDDINVKVYKNGPDGDYNIDNIIHVKKKISYVKKALVYYSIYYGGFIDMETREFYRLGYPSTKGAMFVDVHKSKIYGQDLIGTKKKHYSKKKILKRYNEYKDGDNNEY